MVKKINKKIKILSVILCVAILASTVVGVCFAINSFGRVVKKASKNLTTYAIDAQVNSDYTVNVSQSIDYINNTNTELENICLHLYPRAFRQDAIIRPYTKLNKASCFPNGDSFGDLLISKVNINGESANFEFSGTDSDILKINLYNKLKENKKANIYIDYKLIIPNCTHRFGYYNSTINLGNWYPIVCAFINGEWNISPYYSTGDPFVSECANYNVKITYPQQYSCFATGNKSEENNTSTFSALAVRDFACVLTQDSQVATKSSGKTQVSYVGYNTDTDIQENAQLAAEATSYFSKTFGTYPYKSLTVIKSAFLHGGMEYPNLVIVSDNITNKEEFQKVIVHEIAHQWWYGLVGNNQITQSWLDESLAEYSTCLFFEDNSQYQIAYADQIKDATSSYLLYVDVISSLNGKVNTKMNLPVNYYTSEYEYTYMVYVKGVVMFDSLREVVGKDKLIKSLKKYFKQNVFKIADETNLIECFKSVCHKDIDKFFDGWLSGSNVIGYLN